MLMWVVTAVKNQPKPWLLELAATNDKVVITGASQMLTVGKWWDGILSLGWTDIFSNSTISYEIF